MKHINLFFLLYKINNNNNITINMIRKDIIDAYIRIRKIDQTIPDDVLDFMKEASLEKLDKINSDRPICENCKFLHSCGLRVDFNLTTCDEHVKL